MKSYQLFMRSSYYLQLISSIPVNKESRKKKEKKLNYDSTSKVCLSTNINPFVPFGMYAGFLVWLTHSLITDWWTNCHPIENSLLYNLDFKNFSIRGFNF